MRDVKPTDASMASKLTWGILFGVVIGATFGNASGNTPIGIAVCIAAGAVAAGVWHYLSNRDAGD
jgi:hypothetical protein